MLMFILSYKYIHKYMSFQNSRCTNAGTGSSLTLDGTVECDASVMDGKSLLYGAVGCLSGN